MVNEHTTLATVLLQGIRAFGDHDLEKDVQDVEDRTKRQRDWLLARIKQAVPQTLVVPP